jgi:uncharacterized membrane protein YbhN (UPF0104 family)
MRIQVWLKRCLQLIIMGIIFFFLGRSVYRNWDDVRHYDWQFNSPYVILSLILLLSALGLMVFLWRSILMKMNHTLPFKKAWRIWFVSNLGRYVPGKVWQILGMVYLCEREGIPKVATTTSVLLAQAWSILSAFILMGVYVLVAGPQAFPRMSILLIALVPLGFVLVYPPILEKLINRLLVLLKKEPLRLSMSFGDSLAFLAKYFLSWIVYGVAFSLFIFSIQAVPLTTVPAFICIFAASYTLGFLFLLVPGGLGVREGLIAALLSASMPLHIATIISLLSRLWFTAGELVCLSLALKT